MIISQREKREKDKVREKDSELHNNDNNKNDFEETSNSKISKGDDGLDGDAKLSNDTKSNHLDMSVESDVDRIIDSHDNEYVLSKPNEEG